MSKLLPCPFCGDEDVVAVSAIRDGIERHTVSCLNCAAFGPTQLTANAAAEDWNNCMREGQRE